MYGMTKAGVFSAKEMNRLGACYNSLSTIPVEGYASLKRTIGSLPTKALEQLANSGIRFIGTAANSVLCDKGIRPESARWEHAIDTITDTLLASHTQAATA